MTTYAVSSANKHPEARFSLRYLMLIVAAVAIGLAVGRLSVFNYREGFLATAAVLVAAHLLREISLLRNHADLESHTRRFHVIWRVFLVCCIVSFFVLAFAGLMFERLEYNTLTAIVFRTMFVGRTSPLAMVLQLSFLSYLILGLGAAPKANWRLVVLSGLLSGFFLIYSYGTIVHLVQIAIQAMEMYGRGVQHGEISQYAADSGTMYAGIEQNLRTRTDHFLRVSLFGAVVFLLAATYCFAVLGRTKIALYNARKQLALLMPAVLLAGVYPVWVYGTGIRELCPPFADVGLANGILPLASGVVALLLVAVLLAYRCRERSRDEPEVPDVPLSTLIAMFFACLAMLGLLELSTWTSLSNFTLTELPYYFVAFNMIVTLATLILLVPKLYQVGLHVDGPARVVGRIEPSRMRLIFFTLVAGIAITVPSLWWIGYAWHVWTMQG